MKRRHRHDDHVNHEAWVIPYADLLTLLLALFVVLYAMSSINTTKYRALAQAISAAFNGSRSVIHPITPAVPQSSPSVPTSKPVPIPRTPLAHLLLPVQNAQISTPDAAEATPQQYAANAPSAEQRNLDRIKEEVERALKPLIDKQLIVVRHTPDWLEIEIRTDILFPSGVANLSPNASQVLASIGKILAPFGNPLRVEGYTDDVPIDTTVYPSNWELSAARAASVARLFAQDGVDPQRMGIVGWGQYRPTADNASVDGRNRNRRVMVVVLSDQAAPRRFYANSNEISRASPSANGPAAPQAASPAAGKGEPEARLLPQPSPITRDASIVTPSSGVAAPPPHGGKG